MNTNINTAQQQVIQAWTENNVDSRASQHVRLLQRVQDALTESIVDNPAPQRELDIICQLIDLKKEISIFARN
jgi:hypothetical protein